MAADVARGYSAQQCIDNRVDSDIGIAMAGQPVRMRDPDPAEPEFFAFRKAVHIIAQPHAHGRQIIGKVFGKGNFLQALVSCDQSDLSARRLQDLSIVAGTQIIGSRTMSGKYGSVAERLRRLYAAHCFAVGGTGHHATHRCDKAVDDGQNGDRAFVAVKCSEQGLDHFSRQIGPRSIVNQDFAWRVASKSFQPRRYRLLPQRAARYQAQFFKPGECLPRHVLAIWWNDDDNGRGAAGHQTLYRMSQQGFAAPSGELLWQGLAGSQTLPGRHDNCRERRPFRRCFVDLVHQQAT